MPDDMTTFDDILEKFNNMVWLVAHRFYASFPKDLYDVEDVYQIGLIGLFNAYRGYDRKLSAFSTYAYTCINNAISAELKKAKSSKRMNSNGDNISCDDEIDRLVDTSIQSCDDRLVDKDAVNMVLKAMALLPADQQELVYHVVICGRSTREVAKELGRGYAGTLEKVNGFKKKMKISLNY